jgi:putative membrane protein
MDFSIAASTAGLPEFLAYLAVSAVLMLVYIVVYSAITPHNEFGLIRENNMAAAVAFSGSLLGFVIPLSAAVTNSSSLGDCAVWGLVALVVQIAAYLLLRLPVGNLSGRIAEGQMAAGIWLGAGSLAAGMVNAACMSY